MFSELQNIYFLIPLIETLYSSVDLIELNVREIDQPLTIITLI